MDDLGSPIKVQKKAPGAKGAIGSLKLVFFMIILAIGGTWVGVTLREPMLDLVYDLIGLDSSQLHRGQANRPVHVDPPLNFN